jgi:outer membrane protein assembly factor BamE (lipoprotein component of BamABCDE complex)
MQWRVLFLAAVAILTMPGCKREFGERNLAQLKISMTQKEVESILGTPDRTEKADVDLETQKKTMTITKYYYDQHGETVVVQFQNGRLVGEPAKLKEK